MTAVSSKLLKSIKPAISDKSLAVLDLLVVSTIDN